MPPESSPDPPPSSPPPLVLPESAPPLLPHWPLDGEKHISALGSQQHGVMPLQALPQSASVLQGVLPIEPPLPLPLLLPLLLLFEGGGLLLPKLPPSDLLPPLAFSNGAEFGVDDPHAAMSARAPT